MSGLTFILSPAAGSGHTEIKIFPCAPVFNPLYPVTSAQPATLTGWLHTPTALSPGTRALKATEAYLPCKDPIY